MYNNSHLIRCIGGFDGIYSEDAGDGMQIG
jgi:hypothetical protein